MTKPFAQLVHNLIVLAQLKCISKLLHDVAQLVLVVVVVVVVVSLFYID